MQEQVSFLVYLQYAIKSERKRKLPQDDNQFWLFDEAEFAQFGYTNEEVETETPATLPSASKPRKKRGRRPLPADLPRVDRVIDIPEEDKICACGSLLVKIGEEISEKLNIVPARIEVIRTIRFKYACKQCEGLIAKLYHVEKTFRKQQLSPEHLLEARAKTIRPILDAIEEHMRAAQPKVPPSSLLGKAIAYGLNQWAYVCNYIACPYLTPDNNVAENAIRPFVVGRKNWLFSSSPRGAAASALFYSLIESAKANGLDPQNYLWQTLERLPLAKTEADYDALMPWKQ